MPPKDYLNVLPVSRSKKEARESYDRISRFYDYTEGIFEKKYINMALDLLSLEEGEVVLEIGFGTGNALIRMAEDVGESGRVYGIDISPKMTEISRRKIKKRSLSERVILRSGDAGKLPYPGNRFDAVFLSFTLELFDNPEIPEILKEIKRVLKQNGRLGVISLSKESGRSLFLRLYEWAHMRFPKYIDCRPIYLTSSLESAGFKIDYKKKARIFFAPLEITVSSIS